MENITEEIKAKAKKIKLLLTDCDGVLTDGGVYYSAHGEEMKRFSLRDGMGVKRLRNIVRVETGIVTGENSDIVLRRVEKLRIKEYHPGVLDKLSKLKEILENKKLTADQVAYIGDDSNDLEIMKNVGLSACPADAMPFIIESANMVMDNKGGYGAFRDFAELIIHCKQK
jgi:3-deoxy-D-manno-octulosonate 8-phosphate phosphatase (KDO 8-P phosphatase)